MSTAANEVLDQLQDMKRGEVGPKVHEAVRYLIDTHDYTVADAIREVAEQSGRSPGTISATYYRYQRELLPQGITIRTATADDFSQRIRQIGDLLTSLANDYSAMAEEIARLKSEAERFAEIRSLLT